ncbi:hypothetical protein HPB51_000177 [Rhipicephalus microplus]|uniref:Uncharacterized protein n=1 Tax=Rhipicephalus microplus TaxID=6941 RepID=A0A9J6EPH5_RHIMP|nr:hypothetical protein HPB51_000177 [Rhipicephalus microplus]
MHKKKWKHQADFFFGVLPWTSLLALTTLLSVGSFALLNLRRGKRPMSDLGRVVLGLNATTMSFTSPLHYDHALNPPGRLMTPLKNCCPSQSKDVWSPASQKNSFFYVSLWIATGNSGDIVDVMASAARRDFSPAVVGSIAPYIRGDGCSTSRAPSESGSTAGTASRKRGNASTESEDTELYCASSNESSDDGFQPVLYRKAKRRIVNASSASSTTTVKTAPQR